MKNPLTIRVESSLGAIFVSLLSLFFIGLLFISVKNFETDMDIDSIMSTHNTVNVRKMSPTELVLLQDWINKNSIEVPEGQGYKYLTRKYPEKPWLQ